MAAVHSLALLLAECCSTLVMAVAGALLEAALVQPEPLDRGAVVMEEAAAEATVLELAVQAARAATPAAVAAAVLVEQLSVVLVALVAVGKSGCGRGSHEIRNHQERYSRERHPLRT